MRKVLAAAAVVMMVVAVGLVSAPGEAQAQYRQFTGRIDKINDKQVIVDNRKGDKVKFVRVDETKVAGEGKAAWDDLKKGDWVTVDWKFIDKPRKAYNVNVIPERAEEGEDE
jgi:hypothetical protein